MATKQIGKRYNFSHHKDTIVIMDTCMCQYLLTLHFRQPYCRCCHNHITRCCSRKVLICLNHLVLIVLLLSY